MLYWKNNLSIIFKVAGKINGVAESGLHFCKTCSKIYIEKLYLECPRGMGSRLCIVYWFLSVDWKNRFEPLKKLEAKNLLDIKEEEYWGKVECISYWEWNDYCWNTETAYNFYSAERILIIGGCSGKNLENDVETKKHVSYWNIHTI